MAALHSGQCPLCAEGAAVSGAGRASRWPAAWARRRSSDRSTAAVAADMETFDRPEVREAMLEGSDVCLTAKWSAHAAFTRGMHRVGKGLVRRRAGGPGAGPAAAGRSGPAVARCDDPRTDGRVSASGGPVSARTPDSFCSWPNGRRCWIWSGRCCGNLSENRWISPALPHLGYAPNAVGV